MATLVSSVALAVALITSPELPTNFEPDAATLIAMRTVAIEWEILDPKEQRYILFRLVDFTPDLKLIRKRYVELADAPPDCDGVRFPGRELCNELISLNRTYKQFMVDRASLGPSLAGENTWEIIQEYDRLYEIWDTVRDARCPYYYVTVRRQALKKLRNLVGVANYYGGFLPPHVPVWRFRRID